MYHVSESCILLAHTRVNRASATNDFSPLLHVHSLDLVPEKNCIPQCDKKDFFLVNSFNFSPKHKRQQEIMEKEMVYGSKPATTPKKR